MIKYSCMILNKIIPCLLIICLLSVYAFAESGDKFQQYNSQKKEPAFAAFLSVLLPGAGQAYNGEWPKFGTHLGIALVSFLFGFAFALHDDSGSKTFVEILYLWNWFNSIHDAYVRAEDINLLLKTKYGISSIQLLVNQPLPLPLGEGELEEVSVLK